MERKGQVSFETLDSVDQRIEGDSLMDPLDMKISFSYRRSKRRFCTFSFDRIRIVSVI